MEDKKAIKRSLSNDDNSGEPLIKRTMIDLKKIKENYKQVNGKLLNKMTLSIDNVIYYTFRIMSDNKIKEYYGDSQCFKDMIEEKCYDISLNFVKTKFSEWIQINEYKECEAQIESTVRMNDYLTCKEFENEDSVNTIAKLKYIYKKPNTVMYKIVFEINYKNLNDDPQVIQIECSTNAKMLLNIFKNDIKGSNDINDLIAHIKKSENKIYNVYNVKCQQITNGGNNVYYNWNMLSSTRMEACDGVDNELYANLQDCDNNCGAKINISRSNKHIIACNVNSFKIEMDENNQSGNGGSGKFIIQFKSDDLSYNDSDEQQSVCSDYNKWNRCVFYVNANKKTEPDSLQKLSADLNQMAELLEDDLIKIILYTTVDNDDNRNMNMLGLLKYDDDENEYKFL
ncbi:lef3 [Catopsilia pomona nucleopolyhedrovirus]|uniref:Lef3 n=1 Tax=Catopsilia pomona nucleopolyhedrovirus TaxID=1850906 RepID=A0A172WZE6_9ABAC|nr:lef3 [Catopsilia pomona nucleopolyhedrovirus]ANF29721.1 lef3 [Catopsilia pomona nucleopolyhedrovirus]